MTTAQRLELATETALNAGPVTGRPLRAVIYARVSQDPRQQLRSVSEQVDECTAECERRGWSVVKVFKDNDRSASRYATKERPQYARLITFLRGRNADVLVTWESSRAQRDLEAYLKLRTIAEDNGVQWSYKGRLYDLTRTDDRFTTGLDALLDERESSITRDRILRAKRGSAIKGRPNGAPLYGYRREYDPKTGAFLRQVPCEIQAPVVREAFQRYAAGESLHAIAEDFNTRGIHTNRGNEWCLQTLKKMITWPSYLGKRIHQGQVIGEALWPAIVDEVTFYACVERARAARRPEHSTRSKYLLTNLVACGECGTPLLPYHSRGVVKYACRPTRRNRDRKSGCVTVRIDRLDSHVTDLVVERLSRPDAAALFTREDDAEAMRAALADAEAKRARLEEVYEEVATGDLSATACAKIEARLLPEIERAEEQVAALCADPVLRPVARPDIAEVWPALPLWQQRAVIRALMMASLLPERVAGGRKDVSKRVRVEWKHDL